MITLEGNNIKILKMEHDKRCIEVVDLDNNILYNGTDRFDVIRECGTPIKVKLYHYTAKPVEKALKQDELVDNLIQYGDSWKKIEDNVIEFYAIMMACSDYPIALRNYSSIDEIIQTDDFEETIKDYRELAKQRINFNSLSESDGGV